MWSLSGLSLAAGWLDSLVASWLGERLDVYFAVLSISSDHVLCFDIHMQQF